MQIPIRRWIDAAFIAVLTGVTFVVHDVGYLLNHPYWLDEAWVADSIRAPVAKVPFIASSSPLGWTFLLRLAPGAGNGQSARLLPLLFCALTAVAGYALGEQLGLRRHVGGVLVGTAVLLSPSLLIRADLKQYTAEAFASVAILALAARLENAWSRRRLAQLATFTGLGLLVAPTELLFAPAVFAGLLLETALQRDRRRAIEVVVAGAAVAVAFGLIYLLTVAPNVVPSLKGYWKGYYLPASSRLLSDIDTRLHQLLPLSGLGHATVLALVPLAGIVVLALTGRWALALAAPLAVTANVLAALTSNYPFGDPRTSTYWLVLVPLLAAVAVAWAADWIIRRSQVAGLGLVAAAVVAWAFNTVPYFRIHPIPAEDVRDQVTYFEAHYRPGDVLILDESSSYAFAFYDHRLVPTYARFPAAATDFLPEYPTQEWVVQMHAREAKAVANAIDDAVGQALSAGGSGRVWIVRSHMGATEAQAWAHDIPPSEVQTIPGSAEPLLLYTPAAPG